MQQRKNGWMQPPEETRLGCAPIAAQYALTGCQPIAFMGTRGARIF